MDTSRAIVYRGFSLNDETLSVTGGNSLGSGISGCKVDSVDMSDVDVVQWTEKRSQADGNDTGDAMFGQRRIRMAGTLYALDRATLFDRLWTLRAALNPVLAQREEPLDHGYRPLYFTVPTNRLSDYPLGLIDLQVYALPRAFQQLVRDDEIGGDDDDSLGVPWQATFLCADPGVYALTPVQVNLTTTGLTSGGTAAASTNLITKTTHGLVAGNRVRFVTLTGGTGLNTTTTYYVIASGLTANAFKVSTTSGGSEVDITVDYSVVTWVKSSVTSGTWNNRGTYLGKLNMLVEVGSTSGTMSVQAGDSVFTVTIPSSTGNRIIRVKDDKMVTFEENSVETPQMGSIAFSGDTTYPLIDPGVTGYSVSVHGVNVVSGSTMWFYEQYA